VGAEKNGAEKNLSGWKKSFPHGNSKNQTRQNCRFSSSHPLVASTLPKTPQECQIGG
jgi:hypothetical protein